MVPSRPTEQRKATAAAPRAGSGQHSSPSSPSSGAARASADEALFWCLLGGEICDEICEVICEAVCDDADDAARGAGALTASAASTLKGRRANDTAAPVADEDADAERPRELPHVASAASPWVAACADLLEAAKDHTNMRGLRTPLRSRGFRCGPPLSNLPNNFGVTVPPDFPCYYDVVGKDYATHDRVYTLATLRKYLDGALALARTGGAYRTEAECEPRAAVSVRIKNGRVKTSRFTGVSRDERLGKWVASIYVQGFGISLGSFDVEVDAARTYDAAVVRYEVSGRTLNFPGEAPRAEVLDALPPPPEPIVAPLEVARARRPPRALPRGTTYPDGAMAQTAADLAVGVAGDDPQMKKKSASKKKKKKKKTAEPAKDGGKPKMKKQSGYMYHNAQNRELAKAMVASDPATAQLGAQEKINAVRKKLAAMWGALDDAAKRAYADIAPMVAFKPRKAKKSKVVEVAAAAVGVRAKGLPASKKEPAHVCACCGGTTLTAAGEPMRTSVLFCENDACRAEYHMLCVGLDAVPVGAWRCPACVPRAATAATAEAAPPSAPVLPPAPKVTCKSLMKAMQTDGPEQPAATAAVLVPAAATAEAAPPGVPVLPTEGSPPPQEPAPTRQDAVPEDAPPPPRPKVHGPPTAGFSSSDSESDSDGDEGMVVESAAAAEARALAADLAAIREAYARERPVAAVLGELGTEMVSSVHVAAHTRAGWDASALYAFQAALRRQPGPVCHSFKDLLKSMRSGELSETQGRRSITRLLSGDPRLLEKFQHVVRPSAAAPVGDAVATVAWYDPENPTEELYAYATPAAAAAEFGLAELAVFDCLEGRARHADGVCFRWQTDWPLPAHAVATRRRGVYRLGTEGRFRAQLGERDGFLGNFDSEGSAALVCEAGRAAASRPPDHNMPRPERDAAIPVIPPPEPASWAQCARCDKWRVLASGTDLAALPEEWSCRDGIKTCESVECSLTECATCECHTSNCEVVLVSPAGDVEMRYCYARRAVGQLSHLLRYTHGGRDGLRVLPRDVRVVFGLVRDGRSGPIDEPPERRVGSVSPLSRAVEGRPARGDAHVAAPMKPPTDEYLDRDKA